jgi:lipid II:glycine glycyltransferase (peptidoglycan interpeptide bridge formation enzyme)
VEQKTRNQIKTSYRRGATLNINRDIDSFYNLYLKSIRRLKSIPKKRKFFETLARSFGDNLVIVSAYKDGELAAANLCLIKNKYLHLPFSISDAKYFKDYVNNFIYWETIKLGLEKGIEIFDFGPSSVKDNSHQKFKAGFGAAAIPIFDIPVYNSVFYRTRDFVKSKLRNARLRLNRLL